MTLRERLADQVDEALEAILLAERVDGGPNRVHADMATAAHAALWGCDYHFVSEIANEMAGDEIGFLLADDATDAAEAAGWPVDIAAIAPRDDGSLFLMRIASVTDPAEVRGRVRLAPPRMVTIAHGPIKDGRIEPEITIAGSLGGQWRDISINALTGKGDRTITILRPESYAEEIQHSVSAALAMALTARYSWHVAFGFSDTGPRLLLPTTPSGCLDLFRSRGLHPGQKRRAALRHWVGNHFRGVETSAANVAYVRDHLRGATSFIWNSLLCELMPSAFDLERNEAFRAQAAEWRSARKHNRVRLRVRKKAAA